MTSTCQIYIITNTINDKVYIGQTWQTLEKRFWAHCNKHPYRSKIRNAILKYGRDKFKIESIGLCYNQEDADNMEDFFIQNFDSIEKGYNLMKGGAHGKMSKETRRKMSLARIGKTPVNKGKSTSLETRLKISKNSANKIRLTESQIQAIKSDKRSYEQIAKDYPCSSKTISRICRGLKQ